MGGGFGAAQIESLSDDGGQGLWGGDVEGAVFLFVGERGKGESEENVFFGGADGRELDRVAFGDF